jgi:hypothetical protein
MDPLTIIAWILLGISLLFAGILIAGYIITRY